ncbi:MAG: fumarate hydratase C-terminal domain-containing protein [Kiritimatiellae bacterium]|nr:fumarate hydratase C-terminal domain-containing protein [Kiritimatiellia bacterium]
MDEILIEPPLTEERARALRAGQPVRISGVLYAARDAAHARLIQALDRGEPLPFDPEGAIIYYVGPTPGHSGQIVGSAGPTTSERMDAYAPRLIERGVRGTMGKGERTAPVVEAMRRYGAVYFAAIGGMGALLGRAIVSAEVIAYPDLGTEALRKLVVKDFPAWVGQDAQGGSIFRHL